MVRSGYVRTLTVNCNPERAAMLRWVLERRRDIQVVAEV